MSIAIRMTSAHPIRRWG